MSIRWPLIGETVIIENESGTVRDYMNDDGLPHVAVIEMHDPVPQNRKWTCVDMTKMQVDVLEPC